MRFIADWRVWSTGCRQAQSGCCWLCGRHLDDFSIIDIVFLSQHSGGRRRPAAHKPADLTLLHTTLHSAHCHTLHTALDCRK